MTRLKFYELLFCIIGLKPTVFMSCILPLRYKDLQILMSDIGYQTKVYYDIRYNVRLCALQSDIGRFRYQAQYNIADHGYWTECPPM